MNHFVSINLCSVVSKCWVNLFLAPTLGSKYHTSQVIKHKDHMHVHIDCTQFINLQESCPFFKSKCVHRNSTQLKTQPNSWCSCTCVIARVNFGLVYQQMHIAFHNFLLPFCPNFPFYHYGNTSH